MSALKYWVWLTQLTATAGTQAALLLEHFGTPEAAYAAPEEAYRQIPHLNAGVLAGLKQKSLARAETILENCERLRLRVLTYHDTEYPERLRQIEDPPCVLYVKGQLPQIDDELAITVVGARESTPYGEMTASRFAMDLARQGALVISGIARGIDAAALTGALTGGGRVVSVLGNGIDVIYPKSNGGLYQDIPEEGALLSEYPPGTNPDGSHFPVRNRLLAGLSLGVLLVEGTLRSGSLITARLALEQNRDVFAIPGAWDATMSRAPNTLIQRGEAKLVLCAADILEEYQYSYPHKIRQREALPVPVEPSRRVAPVRQRTKPAPQDPANVETNRILLDLTKEPEAVTEEEAAILLALQARPCTADELIEATHLPARRVLPALTMLQVRAWVTEEAGKRFATPVVIQTKNKG